MRVLAIHLYCVCNALRTKLIKIVRIFNMGMEVCKGIKQNFNKCRLHVKKVFDVVFKFFEFLTEDTKDIT